MKKIILAVVVLVSFQSFGQVDAMDADYQSRYSVRVQSELDDLRSVLNQ